MSEAEYNLKTINRQAADSPIIQMSIDVREGRKIPYGRYGKGVFKLRSTDVSDEYLLKASKIICGKNVTRQSVNRYIRKLKGYNVTSMPYKGEPLIGTNNALNKALFNGQEWTSKEDYSHYRLTASKDVSMQLIDESNITRYTNTIFPQDVLYRSESNGYINAFIKDNELYAMDFGYAVTCHKCILGSTIVDIKGKGKVELITLDNGAEVGEFKTLDNVYAFNGTSYEEVESFFNNGIDDVWEITTNRGYTLTATKDHKFITVNKDSEFVYVVTDKLELGMLLPVYEGGTSIDFVVSKKYIGKMPTYCLKMKDKSKPFFLQNNILAGNCQGSSYPFPIIYEEFLGNAELHKCWLYTAITRSEKKLILISD